jgi:uncharacterized protein YfcZ (UPF0381/DUF406 family)
MTNNKECSACGAVGFMELIDNDDGTQSYMCECGHEESAE